MEKIDRLGWAAGISFTALGVRVGVRVNDPAALERLLGHLPPGWKPSPSPVVERLYSVVMGGGNIGSRVRRFSLLYADRNELVRTLQPDEVFEVLESDLQLHIAQAAQRRLFVHAGVVGWRGRAILIPGRSCSGKTTLVAELVRAGATYYSDEYALLDPHGRVHPYARPLSIRGDTSSARPKKYRVEALGGRSGVATLPVGIVIVGEFRAGVTWRPRRLSLGNGALALLAHTVAARRRPRSALSILRRVVLHAPVLNGVRGEAKEVVASILKRLDANVNGRSGHE
jgi:hypothetical protein